MTKRKIDNDCERATRLIEQKQFDKLSVTDAVDLVVHLADCYECMIYQKQSELITTLCRKVLGEPPTGILLDDAFKEALQNKINEMHED
ncbi:hypothetical protein ABIB40_000270 [Pedobacter sp. UYP30]|uniref:hypothetical protein n=1 Tax=Pedobacter sp. UYP30 TaxID=1756400 RepID=UPI0033914382